MRLNAILLTSSISAFLSYNVAALPIRIVVVEKVSFDDAEAFLRSVRIGHAGANGLADANGQADAVPPNGPVRLPLPPLRYDIPEPHSRPGFPPSGTSTAIPMRPEAEFNILPFPAPDLVEKHAQAIREMCERENQSWKVRFARLGDTVRRLLGLPALGFATPNCDSAMLNLPIPPMRAIPIPPPAFNGASSFAPVPNVKIPVPCHSADNAPVINAWGAAPITGSRFRRPTLWTNRRPKSFGGRLQRALYSLSPWEGRALAFVLGCGLGVLLRMVYVFVVLGVRAWRCRSQRNAIQLGDADPEPTEPVVEAVILFDAASIKSASQEHLPVYSEKD